MRGKMMLALAPGDVEFTERMIRCGVFERLNRGRFPEVFNQHGGAVVVTCADAHQKQHFEEVLRDRDLFGSDYPLHWLSDNGGPLRLLPRVAEINSKPIDEIAFESIGFGLDDERGKGFRGVILLGHGPCGLADLYRVGLVNDPSELLEFQIGGLFEAKDRLMKRFAGMVPGIRVVCSFQVDTNGAGTPGSKDIHYVNKAAWRRYLESKK